MAKELPYFQFEPAEYLTRDVSFCSLSSQGLFVNLCCYYWQRECCLTKEQLLRRLNYPDDLQELIDEGVIDLTENQINIKFLDAQYVKATKQSNINSINGSKGGRPRKENPTKSENKPNALNSLTETKGIREEKIIKDKIKEDNKIENKFSFKQSLLELGVEELILQDYLAVRKSKKATNSQTAYKSLINEIDKCPLNANEAIRVCAEQSWSGFKYAWVEKIQTKNKNNETNRSTNRLDRFLNN